MSTHYIVSVSGHYEARNEFGEIIVTGDTRKEVERELIDILSNQSATFKSRSKQ